MSKLVHSFNGDVIKEYTLKRGVLTIGHKSDSDIHIENSAANDKHAKVFTILNKSFIEDLDSTNGTYINGHKITGHELKNGETVFILRSDDEATSGTEEAYSNIEKSIGEIVADLVSSNTATGPGPAKLQIISGTNTGKELELSKTLTTLGKPDIQVAAITHRPTDYFLIVVDAGKDNKMPLVNDTEIDKQQALVDGDIIEVAGVQMRFDLIES
jgi:hypothetical protein